MLFYLTVILVCQLAGELIVVGLGLPMPGPVIGMILLFAGLVIRGGIPEGLTRVGDAFLSNLSLLFIPAGVGVVLHMGLIAREAKALGAALLGSTLIAIAVTGLLMHLLTRRQRARAGEGTGETGDRP
ncbi:CidA/LrgA family protein [Pannonibacter sp. SL95]|uniref:CidA/LrgA family protein n=1 Tax=Pannonibacter sp. SL95 TaxID=2995153 RepID=UPI0022756A0F|nr:CidA/LrgA family protein [Pannonibacter sp. SL95]MCY1705789.1 CidA/LrgA family protein [Pannonibacter sp. SL95]